MGKSNGQSDLLPLLPKERTWGSFDFSMVNIGLAIATWSFLIGGTLSLFVGLKMGFIATLAGNTVSVLLVALSNAIPSSRFGIDQYVFLRSIFGKKGTKIPVILMVIVEFGWVATLAVMFGKASSNVYGAVTNTPPVSNKVVIVFSLLAILISWLIVSKGSNSINWLNRIVAPLLVTMLIVMFYMLSQKYSFGEMLALEPTSPFPNDLHNYIVAFELGLGSGFSWWPIMGGLARLTKSERASLWPNMIGINICAVLGTMIGLLAGLAVGDSDPTAWMIPIGGPILGLIALVFIAFANVTSMTSLVYSTCLALKQIKFFRVMDWKRLTFIFLACTAVFAFFPDAIYGNFSLFLAACGTVFGPLSAIMFVDYYILRKQKINMRALYLDTSGRPYDFVGGYNITPIISVAVSVFVYFLILDPISFEGSIFFDYASATLPAMLLAGILYYVITKLFVIPKGMGGYDIPEKREKGERSA
ncbi:purine-cytosine permease family protein [Siminovitchia fordii]|uniref:Cytosine/uracil/thiamine/allantoin permease n=1 Tax=Siminovitchia fordii TaxID=254759 RepID=A0ABQ4K202_9BACI|nr:cytosine permease [Siminovitchia fordii]GIN19767.1 cytosine/uracil/thiamine/allantoin permease [Siminovitchia fordii]